MPNHCDNELYVTGSAKTRALFQAAAISDRDPQECLSANAFVPYPEKFLLMDQQAPHLHEMHALKMKNETVHMKDKERMAWVKKNPYPTDGFNSGGHEWCVKHWGTKWGFYDTSLNISKSSLCYSFNTAWSPALPVILAMSEQWPTLTFKNKFWEMGAAYRGVYMVKAGEELEKWNKEYRGSRGG